MLKRTLFVRLMCGSLLGAVAGCAAPVPKVSMTTPLPAHWQHVLAADPAKPSDLRGWWHAFNDPQLDALVDRALANNLDVAQAVERMLATRAIHGRANYKYLPTLSARTDDAIDPNAHASYFVAGFDTNWELGLFGRREGTRREAQGAMDASVADLRSARVSLVAEVVRDWIALRTAQQQEQLLTQISQAHRQHLDLLKVRERLQLVAPAEVDQAQALAAQAEAALAAPRQAINESAQQLAVLVGQNHPDAAWLAPGPQPDIGAFQLSAAPADLLRTRPEIARAEADVLRSAGELALTHADEYPQVSLGASLVWAVNIADDDNHTKTPGGIFSLGPILNIPLFDWGVRVAATHAKSHQLQASVQAYQQAVLQGVAEVETALGSLQQQQQREAQNTIAWQSLQRVDRAVQSRVRLKLTSPLDRIESRIAVDQANAELLDARAQHSLAYVALFKALGGAPLPTAAQLGSAAPKTASSSSAATPSNETPR